ncbi:MAG: CapA family protein [bacterium]|nr:CapA family protein [bacterium]
MKKHLFCFLLLAIIGYSAIAQSDSTIVQPNDTLMAQVDTITNNPKVAVDTSTTEPEIKEFSLIFTGDVMQHDPQIKGAYNPVTKEYEYDSTFHYMTPILSSAEYTIANLELTLSKKPPYTGYPTFCSNENLAVSLKNSGVDCLVTANNHSCDKRKRGIVKTINILDSLQFPHTGTFLTQAARDTLYPMIIDEYGFKLALLNYTYGTNGIPVPKGTVVNLIDKVQIKKDLERAKQSKPDKIIVITHWGYEYKSLPNKQQKDLADYMVKNGADIIIGMHPHVLQPMENYYDTLLKKDVVKVYSLGNFISNQRRRKTDGGAIVRIELQKQDSVVTVSEVGHVLTWIDRKQIGKRMYWYILPASYYEQHPELLSKASKEKMDLFIDDSRKLLKKHNINFPEYVWKEEIGNWVLK